MNVTISIDEKLAKMFRHAAVDENLSLSKWMVKNSKQILAMEKGNQKEEVISDAQALYSPDCDKYERENEIDYSFENNCVPSRDILW